MKKLKKLIKEQIKLINEQNIENLVDLEQDGICAIGNVVGGTYTYQNFSMAAIENNWQQNASSMGGFTLLNTGAPGEYSEDSNNWGEGITVSGLEQFAGAPCAEQAVEIGPGYLCCSIDGDGNGNTNAYDLETPSYDVELTNGSLMMAGWSIPHTIDSFTSDAHTCVCDNPQYCQDNYSGTAVNISQNCPSALQADPNYVSGNLYLLSCDSTHDQTTFTGFMNANSPDGLGGNSLTSYTNLTLTTSCEQGSEDEVLGCLDNGEIFMGVTFMPNGTLFNYSSQNNAQACNYGSSYDTDGTLISDDALADIDYDNGDICDYTCHGCTDPEAAFGYNADNPATIDDGTCVYYGCTNPLADNYCCSAGTDNWGMDEGFISNDDATGPGFCEFDFCGDPDAANFICTVANSDYFSTFPAAQEYYEGVAALLCVEDSNADSGFTTIPGNFIGECNPIYDVDTNPKCGDPTIGPDGNYLAVNYEPINYAAGETSCGNSTYECCIYRFCANVDNPAVYASGYSDHPAGIEWTEYIGPTDGEDAWTGTGNAIQDDSLCLNIGCTGGKGPGSYTDYEMLTYVQASNPQYAAGAATLNPNIMPGTPAMFTGLYATDPDGINNEYPIYYFHVDNDGCQDDDDSPPNPNNHSCCYIEGCTDPDGGPSYNPLATYDPNGLFEDDNGTMLGGSCVYEQFGCTNTDSIFDEITGQATQDYPEELAINEYALNFDNEATDYEPGSCLFCRDVKAYQCDPPLPTFPFKGEFSTLSADDSAVTPMTGVGPQGQMVSLKGGQIIGSKNTPKDYPCIGMYHQDNLDINPFNGMVPPIAGDRFENNEGIQIIIKCCNDPDGCNYWENLDGPYAEWCAPGEGVSNLSAGVVISNQNACQYPPEGYYCDGECIDMDADGNCDVDEIIGCADPQALNYDENNEGCGNTFGDPLDTSCCEYPPAGCPIQQDAYWIDIPWNGAIGCPDDNGVPIENDTSCCMGVGIGECYDCPVHYNSNASSFAIANNGNHPNISGGYRIPYGTTNISNPAPNVQTPANDYDDFYPDHAVSGCITNYADPDLQSALNPCCRIPMSMSITVYNEAGNIANNNGHDAQAALAYPLMKPLWDECGAPIGGPLQTTWGCSGEESNVTFQPDDNCGLAGNIPPGMIYTCFVFSGISFSPANNSFDAMHMFMLFDFMYGDTDYPYVYCVFNPDATGVQGLPDFPKNVLDFAKEQGIELPGVDSIDPQIDVSKDTEISTIDTDEIPSTKSFQPQITPIGDIPVQPQITPIEDEEDETETTIKEFKVPTILNPKKLDYLMLKNEGKKLKEVLKEVKHRLKNNPPSKTEESIKEAITPPKNWINPNPIKEIAKIKVPYKTNLMIEKGLLSEGHGGPHAGDQGPVGTDLEQAELTVAVQQNIQATWKIVSVQDAADVTNVTMKGYACCPNDNNTDCGPQSLDTGGGGTYLDAYKTKKEEAGGVNPFKGKRISKRR